MPISLKWNALHYTVINTLPETPPSGNQSNLTYSPKSEMRNQKHTDSGIQTDEHPPQMPKALRKTENYIEGTV